MIGLIKKLHWEDVKGPLLFISGMFVGIILVAIIYFVTRWKKNSHVKDIQRKSDESQAEEEGDSEIDADGDPNYPSAIIVQDPQGDYLLEDKSQLGQIIDFKHVPRREMDRQAARRELVITMLIAESMSK